MAGLAGDRDRRRNAEEDQDRSHQEAAADPEQTGHDSHQQHGRPGEDILRGQHVCIPPTARSYPYLNSPDVEKKDARLRNPSHAIQYVGFDAERGGLQGASTKGAYMSARYESMREVTD